MTNHYSPNRPPPLRPNPFRQSQGKGTVARFGLYTSLVAILVAVLAIAFTFTVRDEGDTNAQQQVVPTTTIPISDTTPTQTRTTLIPVDLSNLPGGTCNQATRTSAVNNFIESSVTIQTEISSGSGFFYDDSGLVMTAAHVVTGADGQVAATALVGITQGTEISHNVRGQVLGADQRTDIAVIKVETDLPFKVAVFDPNTVVLGQNVIAFGSPFGLENSVTEGIVSQVNRTVINGTEVLGLDLIQTDTSINSGNSGGALTNCIGQVVGVNILIQTGNTGTSGNVGVGFAVPSKQAQRIASQIVDGTLSTETAYLGIRGGTPQEGRRGARVESVDSGTPADLAGLKPADLVIGIENEVGELIPITSFDQLLASVQLRAPKDSITFQVYRSDVDETLMLTAVLTTVPTNTTQ